MKIQDYIINRGDLTFQQDPFNEVDSALLSFIIYCNFEEFLKEDQTMSLQELSDNIFALHNEKQLQTSNSVCDMSTLVLKSMTRSKRFEKIKIHDFIAKMDNTNKIQFAAGCFDLDDKTTYIAIRGTDDSINGWYEDFTMCYQKVGSQIEAADYVKKHMHLFHRYYIGGHSKGGNLAAYSALKCSFLQKLSIINIYSFDGPGLSDELYDKSETRMVGKKFKKFVPNCSIVGQCLETNNDHHTIVKSDAFLINQHYLNTWEISGNRFVYVDQLDNIAIAIRTAFNEFLDNSNLQEREKMVRDFFDAVERAGISDCRQITLAHPSLIVNSLKEISRISPQAKEIAGRLLTYVTKETGNEIGRYLDSINPLKSFFK